jgi:hypothetical protein
MGKAGALSTYRQIGRCVPHEPTAWSARARLSPHARPVAVGRGRAACRMIVRSAATGIGRCVVPPSALGSCEWGEGGRGGLWKPLGSKYGSKAGNIAMNSTAMQRFHSSADKSGAG